MSKEEAICPDCNHALKYHSKNGGCHGAFPDGVEGVDPQEVFYGECLCTRKREDVCFDCSYYYNSDECPYVIPASNEKACEKFKRKGE